MNPVVSLFCGVIEIPWPRFASTVKTVHKRLKPTQQSLEIQSLVSFITLWNASAISLEGQSIVKLLTDFHDLECVDGRDRIAALMALSDDFGPDPTKHTHHFHIDYTRSVEANYIAFAEVLAASQQFYGLFSSAAQRGEVGDGDKLPSWIPDWRRLPQSSYLYDQLLNTEILGRNGRNTVLQRSQTGMTYRLVTPVRYDSSLRGAMLKANQRHIRELDHPDGDADSAEDYILPLVLFWMSSVYNSAHHTDAKISYAKWIIKAAVDLFKWAKAQGLLYRGQMTWPLVFGPVLSFVTLRIPLTSLVFVSSSLRLEGHSDNMKFALDVLSELRSESLSECISLFQGNRLTVCGVVGHHSTDIDHYSLGVASKYAQPGDKLAILDGLRFNIRGIVDQYQPVRHGNVMEGFYCFRQTSVALSQERKYTTIQPLHRFPRDLSDASGLGIEGGFDEYQLEHDMSSTTFAYSLVGVCGLSNFDWHGNIDASLVDRLSREFRSQEFFLETEMGLILC